MITDDKGIIKKLKYIGLDLDDIPMSLKKISNINFSSAKNVIENNYKVYKYINIKDIEILLSPTDRLTNLSEKFEKAIPLSDYFTTDDEFAQMDYITEFLKMVNELKISDIEELENEQEKLKKEIPFKVKYQNDYLWQIYYSDTSDKYFMLVPTMDKNYSALFYTLKKKLENSNDKIFVPICYKNYELNWLKLSEIEQLENYLLYFTKKWPSIYEVYDKKQERFEIVGITAICENIKSEYKISFNKEEDLREFFILIKALFTLETELNSFYKFKIILSENGKIKFHEGKKEITYKNIKEYIKNEYVKIDTSAVKTKEEKMNLQKILKNLKVEARKLEEEYIEKEKYISTFLDCKKTFLGRVKYFFKYKKSTLSVHSKSKIEKTDETQKLKYFEKSDIKDIYTLDELVEECKSLENEKNEVKNLKLDIEAIKIKIAMMDKKISNATKYIEEIDEHKKSIFDFWKFTSKDDANQLVSGEEQEENKTKIKRVFNFETDFEEFARQIDTIQRANLSPKEIDCLFITTTEILEDLNNIQNEKSISKDRLKKLKEELNDYNKIVLGSFEKRIKTLGTAKHRETNRNKLAILRIEKDTTDKEYVENLKQILLELELIIKKSSLNIEMPVYMASKGEIKSGYNIFYINAEEALKNVENDDNVYKINFKNNMKCVAFSNIVFFNNTNQTLPKGMDVSSGLLINTKDTELTLIAKDVNYIIESDEEKVISKKINIFEYDA